MENKQQNSTIQKKTKGQTLQWPAPFSKMFHFVEEINKISKNSDQRTPLGIQKN